MIESVIFALFIALCWGSFLNFISHRLTQDKPLCALRSSCPDCNHVLAWCDLFPIFSWLALKGRCRYCKMPISFLYLGIEVAAAIVFTALAYNHGLLSGDAIEYEQLFSFFAYGIFLSTLLCATRSDLEAMVIPQAFSIGVVPLGVIAAMAGLLSITFIESIGAALLGYGVLWVIASFFKWHAGKEGLGEGDMELLALIGSFIGVQGMWFSLTCGSCVGLISALLYLFYTGKERSTRIPFGPFLSLGAVIYVLFYSPR